MLTEPSSATMDAMDEIQRMNSDLLFEMNQACEEALQELVNQSITQQIKAKHRKDMQQAVSAEEA